MQAAVSFLNRQPKPVHHHSLKPLAGQATTATLQSPREEIRLLEHMQMVRQIASRIHRRLPQSVHIEDLVSAGMLGLIEASAKFNPGKNAQFTSFAQFRVRGAILDSLRDQDWAPRSLRQKERALREADRALNSRLGKTPTEDQIAAELSVSLKDYQKLLGELKGLEIGTLNGEQDEASGVDTQIDVSSRPQDDPLSRCLQGEVTKRLTTAIEALPERQRLVITLYYYEELSHAEISLALGVSEARIQQIRICAVAYLRAALSDFSRIGRRRCLVMRGTPTKTPHYVPLAETA